MYWGQHFLFLLCLRFIVSSPFFNQFHIFSFGNWILIWIVKLPSNKFIIGVREYYLCYLWFDFLLNLWFVWTLYLFFIEIVILLTDNLLLRILIHFIEIHWLIVWIRILCKLFIEKWIILRNQFIIRNTFDQIGGTGWIRMQINFHLVRFHKFFYFFTSERICNSLLYYFQIILQFVILFLFVFIL